MKGALPSLGLAFLLLSVPACSAHDEAPAQGFPEPARSFAASPPRQARPEPQARRAEGARRQAGAPKARPERAEVAPAAFCSATICDMSDSACADWGCVQEPDTGFVICDIIAVTPAGTPCGGSNSGCDAFDSCDGQGLCVDYVDPPGTVCRVASGNCDVAESCDGASKACPANNNNPGLCTGNCDACVLSGTDFVCAPDPNFCTGNCDVCSGSGTAFSCVPDAAVCTGNCDTCAGSGTAFSCAPSPTLCTGNCDTCAGSGTAFSCAADANLCTGNCDACTGSGNIFNCGVDPTLCTGNCDTCMGSGTAFSCGPDPSLCTGNCDTCTGSGTAFSCAADNSICTGGCGVCAGSGTTFSCAADSAMCPAACDACFGSGTVFGCAMDPAQCIPDAGPLDADASPPPSDAGPDGGDGGDAGSTDAGSADAGRTADAAEDDSENAVDAQDLYGCSCRVGGTTARPKGLLLLLVAAAAFGLRRRKRRLFRGTLVALALGALLGAGGVAAAQAVDKAKLDEARRHYEQGQTQYDLGNFDAAIDAYKKAYELSNQPGLLFNIAQAYRLKKDYEKALYFYKSYLRRLPDAQNRADVEARIADMEQQIAANEAAAKAPPTGTIQPTGPSGGGSDAGSGGGARGPGGGGGTTGPGAGSGSSPSGPGSGSIASGSGGGDVADSSVVGEVDTLARARRRWSVGLRADVAPSAPGALLVLGLGLELNERLELDAGAAVGGSYGAWVGATYRLGRGALRPLARVGVPILIEDGTQIGAQGMVGLEIGLGPRLAVRLEGGGAVFPTVDGSAAVALVGVGLASRL